MERTRTACTYDCPDACALIVEHHENGPKIKGDPSHPITRGFVCPRIRSHIDRLRSPRRLSTPLLRRGSNRFDPVSWDHALDMAATELKKVLDRSGPEAVVYYRGGGSLGLRKHLIDHFFYSLGPITTVSGGVCGEAGEAAQALDFGEPACHDYTDLDNASGVVLWGKNPAATGIHLLPFVQSLRRRGGRAVLIEPRHTESWRHVDDVVLVRPGCDGFLALAIIRLLLDRGLAHPTWHERVEDPAALERLAQSHKAQRWAEAAGVRFSEAERLAELYGQIRPLATLVGWGLQRHRQGGANLRCIDALGVVSGNVGITGGGVSFTSTRRRGLDFSMFCRPQKSRSFPAASFGRGLATLTAPGPEIVYIAAANPVTQLPDSHATRKALRQGCGFVIVADAFFTDTAEAADLVLPVTLMLEEGPDYVGSYQHHHIARARRAVPPKEGARADVEILAELANRLGRPADPLLADVPAALQALVAPWLEKDGGRKNPCQPPIPYADGFLTPSGKARLLSEPPAPNPEDPSYPLLLLSVSARTWQTSQLPEEEQEGLPTVWVHPQAAGAPAGPTARLESPLGSLDVLVKKETRMHRSAVVFLRGGWVRHNRGINVLVGDELTDLGQGAAFYSQRARFSR